MNWKSGLVVVIVGILGVVTIAAWIQVIGSKELIDGVINTNKLYLLPLVLMTAFFVFMRFLRWQFLLRKIGTRLPVRRSLSIYLASLVGIATPAYIGEFFIRSLLLKNNYSIPARLTIYVMIIDRLLDFFALAVIGLLTAVTWIYGSIMLLLLLLALLIGIFFITVSEWFGVSRQMVGQILPVKIVLQALGISLAAWIPVCLLMYYAALSQGYQISPIAGMNYYSMATLVGSLSMAPAGIGVTSSLLILQLASSSMDLAASILTVTLLRLSTTLVILIVGFIFLGVEIFRSVVIKRSSDHFDEIAIDYQAQFAPHIWNYLLQRKSSLIDKSLRGANISQGIGLDLGCGLGLQVLELNKLNHTIFGIDMSSNLLGYARSSGVEVVQGSGVNLPFADNSLAFIYTIGVLHHLPSRPLQLDVIREMSRTLRKGGIAIIHETNTRNPLFQLYMSYIFPLLKKIDEGTEFWIEPELWSSFPMLELMGIDYFTFIPDFLPAGVLNHSTKLERALENSKLNTFSVHYMAVLRKA